MSHPLTHSYESKLTVVERFLEERYAPKTTFTVDQVKRLVDSVVEENERSLSEGRDGTVPEDLQSILTSIDSGALRIAFPVVVLEAAPDVVPEAAPAPEKDDYMRFIAGVIAMSSSKRFSQYRYCFSCTNDLGLFGDCRSFVFKGTPKLAIYGCVSCYVLGIDCDLELAEIPRRRPI